MSERVSVGRRAAGLIALGCLPLLACAQAHDVDAFTVNPPDLDASTDEGASGSSGSGDSGSGASGSGASGSGASGSGAAGSGDAGRGDAGSGGASGGGSAGSGNAGSNGGTGQPIFGNVSSCTPCVGAEGSMGPLEPCCTADGECGLDIGDINGLGPTCARQNAPGMESTSCPGYVFLPNFMLTSCCGADGLCGVQIMSTAPLGCVDPALLGDLVMPADDSSSGGGMMFGGGMFGQGQDEGERERCGSNVD